MQIEQSFELPGSPERTWPAFKDIDLLVECLPGASLTGPGVDGELPLRFDVKLGPIAAGFVGSGRVGFDDATRSGRFEGSATDRRTSSRVKGAAGFELAPKGPDTLVKVSVDYTLTGSLAQFSRGGIVRELASALTAQFAANLASRLQRATPPAAPEATRDGASAEITAVAAGAAGAPSPGTPGSPSSSPPRAPGALVPLSAGSLLMHVLKARWRRFVDRLRGRSV